MNGYKSKRNTDQQVIYAFAHVESWLESYAKSTSQSAAELCTRVGTLLLAQGEGVVGNVSDVSRHSAGARVPVGAVEMAQHSHGRVYGRKQTKTQWTPAMRKAASIRMKKFQGKLQAARKAALAA